MAGINVDFSNYDLTTYEGRKQAFEWILGLRADNLSASQIDSHTFEPELIEYTEDETITVRFRPKAWQLNGLKYVQGGILAAMIDCVCGPMSDICSNHKTAGTLDMLTTYYRPITMDDDEIIVKVRMTSNTKRVMHFEVELFNSKGKVAVTASTNIMKAV